MHGNVCEWCSDWYTDRLSGQQIDPVGSRKGSVRVIRGGGWFYQARDVRSAAVAAMFQAVVSTPGLPPSKFNRCGAKRDGGGNNRGAGLGEN